ncbi:MAG: hypothetical protein ACI32W_08605 [Enterococcus faecalis]
MELDQFRDVNLVIDYANKTFITKQFVSQGDVKGRTLTVQVTNNSAVGEVPGLTLNLRWQNQASGLADLTAFSVLDKANSVFRLEYPTHMLTPGTVIASIQILQNGQSTFTKEFRLIVQRLAGEMTGIVEKAEFSALVEVLADANMFRTEIDTLDKNKADHETLEETKKELTQNLSVTNQSVSNLANQKVDKGGASQVTWGMLAQDAREQISGNKVAVVGVNGVTTENYTDSSVTTLKLERPLQESLVEFSKQELKISLGYFSTYDKAYHIVDNYYSIKSQVTPNELYSCDTVVKGEYSAIVHFFSDKNCTKHLESLGIGKEGTFSDFRFHVPAKANSLIVSSYQSKPVLKQGTLVNIQDLANQFKYAKEVETETLNGFYSSLDNAFYPSANYKTAKYVSPKEGERLLFTCNSDTNTVGACICWKNENERLSIISGEIKEYARQEIVVPSGTTFVTVTSRVGTKPLIETIDEINMQDLNDNVNYLKEKQEALKLPQDTLNVKIADDTVEILSKYAMNKDLKRTLKRMSANNTVQLGNFYLIKNTDEVVGNDFGDDSDVLYSQYTDMLAPWGGLRAVNNIDGDQPGAGGYVGGWHAYDNANSGTPTARTEKVDYYCDDIKVSDNQQRYCKKFRAVVTNFVQALNTKNQDGTGREVMKETVQYEFDHSGIAITVEAEMLEDVTLEEYYFLQFQRTTLFRESFLVVGDEKYSKRITDYAIDIYGSNTPTQVTQMIFNGPTDIFEMSYEPTYGIGRLPYNQGKPSWHYRSYGKGYFDLIQRKETPLLLEQGTILHCKGKYKVYRKIN